MRGTRTIAVFAATRADLWPLSPVVAALRDDARAEVVLVADTTAGAVGLRDGQLAPIAWPASADTPGARATAVARLTEQVSDALGRHRPDILLVLGDRYELLAVAAVALLHGVPLAHLHGGEITEGAFDDAVRHAVTKLAHLHLCATDEAAGRVLALGEEPWRVHVTGAPGLDRLVEQAAASDPDAVLHGLGLELRRPFGLLTYHPPTREPDRAGPELEAVLAAADALPAVVATLPGPDPGADAIVERLARWQASRDGVVVVPSLGADYPVLLAAADVVLGNSSSGIIEAPTFGVPTVNVGNRQLGRARARSVLDVPDVSVGGSVAATLRRALDPSFRAGLAGMVNPWGDGKASGRIVEVLVTTPLDPLLAKRPMGT